MRNKLRIVAATATAAVALGVAAPMASAVEHTRATTAVSASQTQSAPQTSTVRTTALTNSLTALGPAPSSGAAHSAAVSEVQLKGGGGAAGRALLSLLRKAGGKTWSAAKQAARGGVKKFKAWANGLSWRDPVKWAVKAASTQTILWVIDQLI